MSESGDYNPGHWVDYDFKSAKKSYDKHVGRSYDDAKSSGKSKEDLVSASLETLSEAPLVIACDVTGSMGEWPAVIFSKLPYLELEGQEYLGKTMEISFAAIGDVYSDNYPLQARPFTAGKKLKDRLEELVIEGNGGGQTSESYDLCAIYYARNVKMPKAKRKPVFIFIGDEGLYDFVDRDSATEYGINLKQRVSTEEVMNELKKKFSVYLIRKPYDTSSGRDGMSRTDMKIYKQWEELLGADHISMLPKPDRVVDVIFGILAKETKRIDYFHEEITGRQKPEQVEAVIEALKDVHGGDTKKSSKKQTKEK